VARSAWPKPWAAWGFDATDSTGSETVSLTVLEGDAAEHVERVLGRRVGWQQTGSGSARQSGMRCDSTPPIRRETPGRGSPPTDQSRPPVTWTPDGLFVQR
jgi:hypothetical protein